MAVLYVLEMAALIERSSKRKKSERRSKGNSGKKRKGEQGRVREQAKGRSIYSMLGEDQKVKRRKGHGLQSTKTFKMDIKKIPN